MQLDNARVLVTGGSAGIGLEIARQLGERGARVAIIGRTAETLAAAAESVGAAPIRADVSVEADAVRAVAEAVEALGGLDALVNNAGVGYLVPLLETEAEPFEQVWRTNVLGATWAAREAARHFVGKGVEHGAGSIVNVGSTASLRGFGGGGPYCATKFALRALTESWRGELRPHGVRVMQVNPSEVMTEFGRRRLGGSGEAPDRTEAERATKLRPEDIAHAVLAMLAMDDRGFITEATVFATNPKP